MSKDDLELVHGSGNVFRDLDHPNPEVEQLKAILAAKIIAVLDDGGISVRRAHELTGFAAADFSRVRQARLSRFPSSAHPHRVLAPVAAYFASSIFATVSRCTSSGPSARRSARECA
jgi:Helix-turn-helix domain